MSEAEKGESRTLYAVILAGLIEWAGGDTADLEDCRSAARYLTPAVRDYVSRTTSPAPPDVDAESEASQ